MQITPRTILAENHIFNTRFLALQDSVSSDVQRVYTALRASPPRQTHMAKVSNAALRNGMFGFQTGAKGCLATSMFLPTPMQPIDLRRCHLPGSMGRFFGPAGVLLAGHALVGTLAPVTPPAVQPYPWLTDIETFFSKGLTGYAVDALHQTANRLGARGSVQAAQACRWGAALLAVASTVLRVALRTLQTCLAIAVGMCLGSVAALTGALMQLASSPTADVVDLERILDAFFRRPHAP